jgi:hypothetical protein
MNRVLRVAATVAVLLALSSLEERARAAVTILANGIVAGTTYTYGDTTFKFSSCTSCSNLELLGVSNGRGGTEIEIEEKTSVQSYIFTNSSTSQTLSFVLAVGTKPGTHGISDVTNIVNGADGGVTSNDSKVTSVLSSFTGLGTVTTGPGGLTTQLNEAQAIAASWPLQTTSFSLKDTLTETQCALCTLKLTNVALLFTPAPEPASIALLATGLTCLAAARRRFRRRDKR